MSITKKAIDRMQAKNLSLKKALYFESIKEMNVWVLFLKNNPLNWLLLFLLFLSCILFIERFFLLHKDQIHAPRFLAGIFNLLDKQRILEALTVCNDTQGSIPRVLKEALSHTNDPKLKFFLDEAILLEGNFLERRIHSIALIAKIALLIGFLGTLLEFLRGFWLIYQMGAYASLDLFVEPLTRAMSTSILGLFISIIAYCFHHFLCGRLRAILFDLEWVSQRTQQYFFQQALCSIENTQNTSSSTSNLS